MDNYVLRHVTILYAIVKTAINLQLLE